MSILAPFLSLLLLFCFIQLLFNCQTMRIFSFAVTLALAGALCSQNAGAQTKPSTSGSAKSSTATAKPVTVPADISALLSKYTCLACHKADAKLVGPAYVDVAKRKYKPEQIVELIYNPKPEHWPGYPPMAPMKQVPKEDALKIAKWINTLASAK